MLFNLILGILAGIGSRYLEDPLGVALKGKLDLPEADLRVLSFIVILLAASLLIGISGANGMPIMLLIGGGLGIFGSHVLSFGKSQKSVMEARLKEQAAQRRGDDVEAQAQDAATADEKPAPKKKPAAKKPAAKKTTTAKKTSTRKPAAKK